MGYRCLKDCVDDLERHGHLIRVDAEVDPRLEIAEIQRRVYAAGGPALYFSRVKGTAFPMVGNLFGTLERARFMFRDSLDAVQRLVELKVDPSQVFSRPLRYLGVPWTALTMLPKQTRHAPVLANETRISALPQLHSWPDDGGAFVTLPQVYTEDPDAPGPMRSNLGMYRVQLSGGQYEQDREIGLHYQLHRGIGVHHTAALRRGERLRVNVFVGGPPAMTLAAVMPLPEGLPELLFAGALGRRRVRLCEPRQPRQPDGTRGLPVHADADFCISGYIEPGRMLPEGPFGDHLGYYSLKHDFPVFTVEHVYHRSGAIWPFTVVGRPPQEDSTFGELIHELTGPVIPTVVQGVQAVNAVDAAGVHPLLLAIGSERYSPYAVPDQPQELLTQANAILGQGQMSLAKYVCIVDGSDAPELDVNDIPAFLAHVLARFEPRRDLHFQTETTIDTLDYSGPAMNQGSKLVIAARGKPRRALPTAVPAALTLPAGFEDARVCLPGVLALRGPGYAAGVDGDDLAIERLCAQLPLTHPINTFPLVVICDDSELCARSLNNFLWVTFTRSNPAVDVYGVASFTRHKHWGCAGALVIDARRKPWHAPPLIEDPKVTARVDELAKRGGPLFGLL
ncbi:MAG TPA: UbiD family decarboxylase [Polyangiales bacterium]